MDKITQDRIDLLHPSIREEVRKLYTEANNKLGRGVRLRFSHTYRSPEEQTELYAQGRTKKGAKVTNSKAWESIHQYRLAFDICLLYDKNGDGVFEEVSWDTVRDGDGDGMADWLEVTTVFVKAGYSNGFLSNGKKWDLPHFQKTFGLTWRQLYQRMNSKQYTIENGIKYVKL